MALSDACIVSNSTTTQRLLLLCAPGTMWLKKWSSCLLQMRTRRTLFSFSRTYIQCDERQHPHRSKGLERVLFALQQSHRQCVLSKTQRVWKGLNFTDPNGDGESLISLRVSSIELLWHTWGIWGSWAGWFQFDIMAKIFWEKSNVLLQLTNWIKSLQCRKLAYALLLLFNFYSNKICFFVHIKKWWR